MKEYWDSYTRDGKLTPTLLLRGDPIPNGLYHIVCEVLVQHEDGDYLLMQRDYGKPSYPGCYEASAGGSALQGESPEQAIQRELTEETGLLSHRFELVNFTITEHDHCLYYSYVCTVNAAKDTVTLQQGETIGYRWVNRDAFNSYLRSNEVIEAQKKRYLPYLIQTQLLDERSL